MGKAKRVFIIEDNGSIRSIIQTAFDALGLKDRLQFFNMLPELLDYMHATDIQPLVMLHHLKDMDSDHERELERRLTRGLLRKHAIIPFIFFSTDPGVIAVPRFFSQLGIQGFFQTQLNVEALKNTFAIIMSYWQASVVPETDLIY